VHELRKLFLFRTYWPCCQTPPRIDQRRIHHRRYRRPTVKMLEVVWKSCGRDWGSFRLYFNCIAHCSFRNQDTVFDHNMDFAETSTSTNRGESLQGIR
jgi:hypothetical protein